ncbi:MAG: cyclic nucleotide-binding domain-containing protein [Hyphomicrobium sp.]
MDAVWREIGASLSDPGALFGHFTYLLLIVSMLMRTIVWLRLFATAAGIAKIVYRTWFVFDPVSILWESLFVLVNIGELLLIWWQNRPPTLNSEERGLVDTVAPKLSASAVRALIRQARWRNAAAGEALTRQGVAVGGLIYIAAGEVDIEAGGRRIGGCGPGDYLGEMTWADGAPATATAIARGPVRYAWFDRAALGPALRKREVLRYALQASISRNLIDKLRRATGRDLEPPGGGGVSGPLDEHYANPRLAALYDGEPAGRPIGSFICGWRVTLRCASSTSAAAPGCWPTPGRRGGMR